MYQVIIRDEVLDDLKEAYLRYEELVPGLGERLLQEWDEFCEHLEKYPQSASIYRNQIRQARLHKFPYLIMYELFSIEIVVFSIIHNKQLPSKRTRKK